MANKITDSQVHGTDLHSSQRGHVVVEALNRIGAPLADSTKFFDGGAFSTRQIVGTWTIALGANGVVEIAKAAAAETGHVIADVTEATRDAAERGLEVVGARISYTVETAALTDLQLLICEVGGDLTAGSEPTRTVLAGDVDTHYDAANDTAAERGAIAAAKLATVTLPAAAFLSGFDGATLEVLATDPGTAVVTVHGAWLLYRRVDLDVLAP